MPELYIEIVWPDGSPERCYSPSTIVKDYFRKGGSYPVDKFVILSRLAFQAASDRVSAVHGAACSLAMAQLASIEKRALTFNDKADAMVSCVAFIE